MKLRLAVGEFTALPTPLAAVGRGREEREKGWDHIPITKILDPPRGPVGIAMPQSIGDAIDFSS